MLCALWLVLLLPFVFGQDNTQVTDSISNPLHTRERSCSAPIATSIEMSPVDAYPRAEIVEVQVMERFSQTEERNEESSSSVEICVKSVCTLPLCLCAILVFVCEGEFPIWSTHHGDVEESTIDDYSISLECIEEYFVDAEAILEIPQIGTPIN